MTFTETTEWGNVVKKSYDLSHVVMPTGSKNINLYAAKGKLFGKYYANAPYGSYEDIEVENKTALISSFYNLVTKQNLDYILLRTSGKIDFEDTRIKVDLNYYTFKLNLNDEEDHIYGKIINGKTRNQIKKGYKSEAIIKWGNLNLFEDFYTVISKCWQDLGTPIHSKVFFKEMVIQFKENVSLLVIYTKNKPVSTALVIKNGDTLFHPFSCTLKSYKNLSINNVLYWEIIKYGIDSKIAYFDLGRSHTSQGTFKYKKNWGAVPVQLYYYYFMKNEKSNIPEMYNSANLLATRLWKMMPYKLTTTIGPTLIKNIL